MYKRQRQKTPTYHEVLLLARQLASTSQFAFESGHYQPASPNSWGRMQVLLRSCTLIDEPKTKENMLHIMYMASRTMAFKKQNSAKSDRV